MKNGHPPAVEREETRHEAKLSELGYKHINQGKMVRNTSGMNRRDKGFAKQSLKEENKAIADYGSRLKTAKHTGLRKALTHAKKDEKHHAAMFAYLGKFNGE